LRKENNMDNSSPETEPTQLELFSFTYTAMANFEGIVASRKSEEETIENLQEELTESFGPEAKLTSCIKMTEEQKEATLAALAGNEDLPDIEPPTLN
jgi:transketolase